MNDYNIVRSQELFERIGHSIAGGESSYARLRAGIELCIDHTAGTRIWDVDGNEYIDYCLGYGPLIFGHSPQDIVQAVVEQISTRGFHFSFPHELDYKVGEAVQRLVPSVDLIRFTCSGTESTMAAIRLARAYTGKDKIIKFEGAYHGWSDLHFVSYHPELTMAAGRYNAPRGLPDSTGMPQAFVDQLIIQPFNDLEVIEKTIRDRHFEIAAILIEPAMANCGVIPPVEGYLEGLRKISEQYGVLLIFDEVMTGFRIAPGGAQEYYNIKPDISTFAKAIGAGFPVACFGGTKEVMEIEAQNEVMHGGTYTASPLVLAAADAVLQRIERDKETMYPRLFELSDRLRDGLVRVIREAGFHCFGQGVGPLFQVFIGDKDIDRLYNYRDTMDYVRNDIYSAFHAEMQKRGIYCHPSVFERWFMSTEHTDQEIDDTIAAADESMRAVAKKM
ncbi:Glutamate-1-semialdehyde 2,1-aminomutase (EC [Olavius algarvensis Delta 1 endosymbiont]|nr:Glutamate-1-semialdehyde 2,1-aminomutase (EC [Olavius algarvensis Delta 1 endosymbiont]